MSNNEKAFNLLQDIMDKFREVADLSENLCIIQNAEALHTLTLALQEQVRQVRQES